MVGEISAKWFVATLELCGFFQRYKSTVLRRYNDFVAFQEIMLLRFPYRMIPRLPPKKMMGGEGVLHGNNDLS